jgi:hypothetical protein
MSTYAFDAINPHFDPSSITLSNEAFSRKDIKMIASTKMILAAGLAYFALTAAAQTTETAHKPPPRVSLDGDTRACHGHFTLTPSMLRWSATRSRCTASSPKLIAQDATSWSFAVVPSKSCPYVIVKLVNVSERKQLPASEYPLWLVDGFVSLQGFQQQPNTPDISCNMQ